jgi:hypothetical protein
MEDQDTNNQYGRQPAENRPVCPYCKTACTAGSSPGGITKYYCRNEDCGIFYSVKVPRPNLREIMEQQAGEMNFDPRKR